MMLSWLLPRKFRVELEDCIERIPRDLIVWEEAIAKLGKKKTGPSIKKARAYVGNCNFYKGKLMAYIWVHEQLLGGKLILSERSRKYISKMMRESNKLAMNKGRKMSIKKL